MIKDYLTYIKESVEDFQIGMIVKHKSHPGWGIGVVKYYNVEQNSWWIEFENATGSNCEYSIANIKKFYAWGTSKSYFNRYEILGMENKIKRVENPDIDPYNEEDWGWEEMKENLTDEGIVIDIDEICNKIYNHRYDSHRKDREYEKKLRNILLNKVVEFRTNDGGEITVKDVIVDLTVNDTQVTVTISNGKKYCLWYVKGAVKLLNQRADDLIRKNKERLRKIEELKLKMKDIDPYGEEEWENESIVYSSHSFPINMSKIHNKYSSGGKNFYDINGPTKFEDEMRDLLLNKIVQFRTLSVLNDNYSNEITIIDKIIDLNWNKDNTVIVTLPDGRKYNLLYGNNSSYDMYIIDPEEYEKEQRRKEELKLKMKDIDPYGEEEWE